MVATREEGQAQSRGFAHRFDRCLAGIPAYCLLAVIVIAGACRGRAVGGRLGATSTTGEKGSAAGTLLPATSADVLSAVQQSRGSVVLVNLWATWCEPCKEEFPALLRLNRELRGRSFKLILVSADFPDLRPQVERFLTDRAVDFSTFLKVEADDQFINRLEPRWSGALPATIVFDASGSRRQFWEGKTSYETLLARVSALLPAGTTRHDGAAARADTPALRN